MSSVDCISCGIIIPRKFTSLLSVKAKHVSRLTSVVIECAEGLFSMASTKQQNDEKCSVMLLEPSSWELCGIISAKCACIVQEEGFEKVWNGVCRPRDACHKALQGFFIYVLFEI